ncbi:hypothetical protein [Sphingomonas sp.]|uniref:hypothetical protein n=1 Tax=Sphingomonas sp. TaxID=28214 RepID=UPI003B0066A5
MPTLILLLLAVQMASPAAQPTPAPAPADRKVCRSETTTGSIMPGKRTCHLRSEWAAIDAANGRSVDTFRDRPQNGLRPGGVN